MALTQFSPEQIEVMRLMSALLPDVIAYLPKIQENNRRLNGLVDAMAEELEQLKNQPQPTERQANLEAFLLSLAPDIEYQERRIERGYDVEDRIRKRVAEYRELFPREGESL